MALHRTVEDRVGESTLHLLRLRDLVRSQSRLSRKPSPDALKSLPASAGYRAGQTATNHGGAEKRLSHATAQLLRPWCTARGANDVVVVGLVDGFGYRLAARDVVRAGHSVRRTRSAHPGLTGPLRARSAR
jgi:hypothetical protein